LGDLLDPLFGDGDGANPAIGSAIGSS